MKCEKCGKEINDKAKFCRHCGSLVKHNEAEEQKKRMILNHINLHQKM